MVHPGWWITLGSSFWPGIVLTVESEWWITSRSLVSSETVHPSCGLGQDILLCSTLSVEQYDAWHCTVRQLRFYMHTCQFCDVLLINTECLHLGWTRFGVLKMDVAGFLRVKQKASDRRSTVNVQNSYLIPRLLWPHRPSANCLGVSVCLRSLFSILRVIPEQLSFAQASREWCRDNRSSTIRFTSFFRDNSIVHGPKGPDSDTTKHSSTMRIWLAGRRRCPDIKGYRRGL